jgi:hypothetical protein
MPRRTCPSGTHTVFGDFSPGLIALLQAARRRNHRVALTVIYGCKFCCAFPSSYAAPTCADCVDSSFSFWMRSRRPRPSARLIAFAFGRLVGSPRRIRYRVASETPTRAAIASPVLPLARSASRSFPGLSLIVFDRFAIALAHESVYLAIWFCNNNSWSIFANQLWY